MIFFIFYQNFKNQKSFHAIQFQNIIVVKTFFQQMFKFKKKNVNKIENSFLNSNSFRYVKQNERYFANWLNCFREKSFMILKKHIFVSKWSSMKMTLMRKQKLIIFLKFIDERNRNSSTESINATKLIIVFSNIICFKLFIIFFETLYSNENFSSDYCLRNLINRYDVCF